jgi:hypothetical protein
VWWRSAAIGIVAGLVSMAGGGSARAQSAPDVAPRFAVEVQADPGQPDATVQVQAGTGVLPCGQRCVLELPEGRYRVLASGAGGRQSGKYVFINGPSRLLVTPASDSARSASFVLMTIGAAGLGGGVVLLFYALVRRVVESYGECPQGCADSNQSTGLFYAGAISAGIGMAAGVTGLVLWQKNKHAGVEVEPLAPRFPGGAHLHLQPAAGWRWTGLALTGIF